MPGGGPRRHEIAIIRGDGIGPEIVEAALEVVHTAAALHGAELVGTEVLAGAAEYERTGVTMSEAALDVVRSSRATFKGPVGLPAVRRPDGTEAGLLGGILRIGLDLYANVRPIRSRAGVAARVIPEPGGIDYVIVRENTEGMYAARGLGVGNDWAVADTMLITRPGSERIARFAFDLALRRAATGARPPKVTCVDKANVLRSMYFFRQIVREVSAEYPTVELDFLHVDAAAEAFVVDPERFDVVLTENLFGDILSDLGGGTIGGIALCPGGNIGVENAYFEPIHGSAPSIAGTAAVNPVGQILAGAMMLEHLGESDAAAAIDCAVDAVLGDGSVTLDRRGGSGIGAAAVGRLVAERL